MFVGYLQLRHRDGDSKLLEEELELGHGVGFPLFKGVDSLLDELVLLCHVTVLRVVLATKHLLLLFQVSVFSGETQKVQVED